MSGWAGRLGAAVALAGALSAGAAAQYGWFNPEETLQKGQEALFRKRYALAARLCTRVYLEDPANAEARRCLREAARAGAAGDLVETQQEARRIRREAERNLQVEEFLRERRYLEAYDMLYKALESEPSEAWARAQLAKVQDAAEEGIGRLPDERAREAAWGFYYLTRKEWASYCRAKEHWEEALKLQGAKIPTSRIARYLAWIESYAKRRAQTCAPPEIAADKLETPEEINRALDELLK